MKTSRRRFVQHAAGLIFGGTIVHNFTTRLGAVSLNQVLVQRAFYSMGTVVTISAYGPSSEMLHHAISKAYADLQQMDERLSLFKSESDVSAINRTAGKNLVIVDSTVLDILEKAKEFHNKTNGAFNICIEPLMRVWGFRGETRKLKHIPEDKEIDRALNASSIAYLTLDKAANRVGLENKFSAIDLGGIAVGYAVDRMVSILRSEGVENALINHSGDIFAMGAPPDQQGWIISLPNPNDSSEIMASFLVKDQAVSTSGNYESFVEFEDERFGHILNSKTGKPSDGLLSYTVMASSAIDADAYSTGFFSSGQLSDGVASIAVRRDSRIEHHGEITFL
ncbi:FAD:protein FMN transferase [bacterium]|nr:FAD:protein FMN transferase [bacterium]